MPKMSEKTVQDAAETLKAVAHPVRLQIVELLQEGEKSVGEIAQKIGSKQSITSQQLSMMKDREVLECRREGAKVYYRIKNPNIIKLLHCIYKHRENSKETENN